MAARSAVQSGGHHPVKRDSFQRSGMPTVFMPKTPIKYVHLPFSAQMHFCKQFPYYLIFYALLTFFSSEDSNTPSRFFTAKLVKIEVDGYISGGLTGGVIASIG